MASTNPYDPPPSPTHGDSDANITYAAVGRAIIKWEAVEVDLATLFMSLIGGNLGQLGAIRRAYGSVLTFRGRKEMIEAVKETFFAAYRDKVLEADLKKHLDLCANYSPRRNEIAHGIVQPHPDFEHPNKFTWVLMPSEYATNKRRLNKLPDDLHEKLRAEGHVFQPFKTTPKYLYSSVEIDFLGQRFDDLVPPTSKLIRRVLKARIVAQQPGLPEKPA